jgi:TetR/AcrR family transcriptional repressor of multidrug resistance operon
MIENPLMGKFFDQMRSSSYQLDLLWMCLCKEFKVNIGRFMDNVVARGEINEMPFEVYWSVAFAPLIRIDPFPHGRAKRRREAFYHDRRGIMENF